MKSIISLLFSVIVILSCSDETPVNKDTFEYFETHLMSDMKYDDFKHRFGIPDEDRGSGIHIYVYNLDDCTKIVIGYTDHIHYAKHVDGDFNELQVLL